MDKYYVQPNEHGEWHAFKGEGASAADFGMYPSRDQAMEACRDDRGDERDEVFYADGQRAGVIVRYRGPEALWILNVDGSVYGEVDAEVKAGGTPIVVNIAAPETKDEAPSIEGQED